VKKFNWDKFRKIFWFLAAILVVVVVWPIQDSFNDDIRAHRFCAYGQVYAEFEHNGKTWGTTFLDDNGKPVRCSEDDTKEQTSLHKETI